MSTEKYNADLDVFANREIKRDFGKLFLEHQVIEPEKEPHYKYLARTNNDVMLKARLYEGLNLKNPLVILTTLGFTWLGGLYHARKNFIGGFNYYNNYKFDFLAARKNLFVGFSLGLFVGVSLFGELYKVEDYIRSKLRAFKTVNPVERHPIQNFRKGNFPEGILLAGTSTYDKTAFDSFELISKK